MDSQDSSTPALILMSGGDTDISKITKITVTPFLIGRAAESSLQLLQKSVSRKQCSIERIGSKWVIRSLGSRPIILNSYPLFEGSLKSLKCFDVIELPGVIKFKFKCSLDQNGHCCDDFECSSLMRFNNSNDFAVPTPIPCTSAEELFHTSSATEKLPLDCSSFVVDEIQSNVDNHVDTSAIDPIMSKSFSVGTSNLGLLLETDRLTEVILTYAAHLEESKDASILDNDYSRLSDELRLRLEFAEAINEYGIDESCKAHERNENISNLLNAVKKLTSVLNKKDIDSPKIEEAMGTNFNENMERIFLSIDELLINKANELVNVINKLPNSLKTLISNNLDPSSIENNVSQMCCCKRRNRKIMKEKRKEPVDGDKNEDIDDDTDVKKKVKWQEAKIQFLQMKLKEKENVSSELESTKVINDGLVNKVAELKRILADKDIMELEFRVLQESIKYKEEDKRSKDILQERIDCLQSESTNLKIENEKLIVDLQKTKNEIVEMMEKYKILEEKLNEKTNSSVALNSLKDGSVQLDYCCELGGAKISSLIELMERELNCSICGEMFIEPTVTNCNHAFCTHCLSEWKKMKRECPFCRTIVVKECKISFLDEFINSILKLFSPKLLDDRLILIKERINPPAAPPPAKRPRTRGRQNPRATRNSRGQQNPRNAVPYYVDPRIVDIP